jgi:Ca-activated chloride channel homolog
MNINDPKLTAYALDELAEVERAAIAHEVAASPEAQREIQETQTMARLLRAEFAAEFEHSEDVAKAPLSANLSDIRDDPWFWSIARPLTVAAVIAVFAVIGLAIFGSYKLHQSEIAQASRHPTNLPLAAPSAVEAEMAETATPMIALQQLAAAQPEFREEFSRDGDIRAQNGKFNTADYGHFVENPFLAALDNPLSTFSIDVDTTSYAIARRLIKNGTLPPKDAVRVEEMINYFTYEYPRPKADEPFSINVDVASCPWEEAHRLVRIGLKGREIAQDKRGPSNLVFLLDVSGSMTPPERLPLVKQAMRLLVEKLSENDRVAIVVYAGASGLALPSTIGDHKEQILSALESLQPGGSTNGAEGIQLAYKIAADNFIKGGVNRVILATDGDFNIGVTSQGELIRLIEEKAKSGVFLSVLGVGDDNLKDSTMQKLADKGNGNYAYLDSLDEARKVLVQQMNGTLVTIAKDVKIQVEFNPAQVASYRLIGYEKRMLRKEDFNNDKIDAGEIGAGHTVTALYEVVPVGASTNPAADVPPVDPLKYGTNMTHTTDVDARSTSSSAEMLTVKLRYKKPDGDKSELIERAVVDDGKQFANASADFKFAAAVAEFGMLLRDSEFRGNGTLGAVLEWAREGKGIDPNGSGAGFLDLVRKAQALKRG